MLALVNYQPVLKVEPEMFLLCVWKDLKAETELDLPDLVRLDLESSRSEVLNSYWIALSTLHAVRLVQARNEEFLPRFLQKNAAP